LVVFLIVLAGICQAEVIYSEMTGIYATDRNTLILSLLYPLSLPYTITLMVDDTKDKKVMIIESVQDIPYKSISSECPKSEKYQFQKCWFIKYEKEGL